jgi:hypothetical protein
MDGPCGPPPSGPLLGPRHSPLALCPARWPQGQGGGCGAAGARLALAAAPQRPGRARGPVVGQAPDLGRGHGAHRRQAPCGSVVPGLLRYTAPSHALGAVGGAASRDGPGVPSLAASLGHRCLPSPPCRGLLWAPGVTPEGVLCPVLYDSGARPGAGDDGRERVQLATSWVSCRLPRA